MKPDIQVTAARHDKPGDLPSRYHDLPIVGQVTLVPRQSGCIGATGTSVPSNAAAAPRRPLQPIATLSPVVMSPVPALPVLDAVIGLIQLLLGIAWLSLMVAGQARAQEPADASIREPVRSSARALDKASDKASSEVVTRTSGEAWASAATPADELAPVVVSDAPMAPTGEVEHSDFTGGVQRLQGEMLQRRDITLDGLLARQSGVQSRSTGGFGSFASISLRAATPSQTGIYLDGIRLNSGGNSAVDLSTLELLNIGQIDLYRGATPLPLSHDTLGGAINLITRRAETAEPDNRLQLGIGSFGHNVMQVAHASHQGRWDLIGTLSRQQADNDFDYRDDNATPLNRADDRQVTRRNAQAERLSALGKASQELDEQRSVSILIQLSSRRLGVPEWRNRPDNQASFDTDALQLQAGYRHDGLGVWNTRHTLFGNLLNDHYDDRFSQVGLGAQDAAADDQTLGLASYGERVLGSGLLGLNLELRREGFDSTDRLNPVDDVQATRNTATLGAQWTWYSSDDRWSIAPLLRWHQLRDRVTTRSGASDSRGTQPLAPQLGVRFDATETLTLRASLGRYFREPSFAELFVNRGLLISNPDLVAETGLNGDLGLSWQPRKALVLEASVFASQRDELIAYVFDARGIGRSENVGEASIVGLETSLDWQVSQHWRGQINLTLQDAANLNANPTLDGKQLPGEARRDLFARLGYRPNTRWQLWAEAQGLWDRFYDTANLLPATDQWLQNLGVDWQHKRWQTALALHNLGDDNIEDFNGFPRPGRTLSLTVTYQP